MVYTIAKNEAHNAKAWAKSMSEADGVYVLDTGSTDDTADILRKHGTHVVRKTIAPWRFDTARNRSLALVPEDADICVCTDLDERFVTGWRAALETAVQSNPDAVQFTYEYHWRLHADGSPDVTYRAEKAHRRRGFSWIYPVHEVLYYDSAEHGNAFNRTAFVPDMVLKHFPDNEKPRSGYLPLLELAYTERPNDPRCAFYLGREYFFAADHARAVPLLSSYIAMPHAVFAEERATALSCLARCYLAKSNEKDAEACYLRALLEAPAVREPYGEFAIYCYQKERYALAALLCRRALALPANGNGYLSEGFCKDSTLPDICAVSLSRCGDREGALYYARLALSLDPDNERLIENVRVLGTVT